MEFKRVVKSACSSVLLLGALTMVAPADEAKAPPAKPREEAAAQSLGKTIRVEFLLRPDDDGKHALAITTALPWFAANGFLKSEDGRLEFDVTGEIRVQDDQRYFVSYVLKVVGVGKQGDAGYTMHASAVLKDGEAIKAAAVGDKTLVIRAIEVEDAPVEAPRKDAKAD